MPEIVKPGNPDAAFPVGALFICTNCGCEFKLVKHDQYDLLAYEGTEQTVKLVYTSCPNCSADVSAKRLYKPVPSSVASPDGEQSVGIGRLSAESYASTRAL